MLLIIARHGQSDLNKKNINSGQRTPATLSDLGLRHAEALAAAMESYDLDAIYSSPLARASMTAEPTAKSKGLSVIIEPRIIEMDFGECDGLFMDDPFLIKHNNLRFSSNDYKMPGGESYAEVIKRAESYYEDLIERKHKCVLHVSHLGFNRGLISILAGTPVGNLKNISSDNGIVYLFDTGSRKMNWIHTQTKEKGAGIVFGTHHNKI